MTISIKTSVRSFVSSWSNSGAASWITSPIFPREAAWYKTNLLHNGTKLALAQIDQQEIDSKTALIGAFAR